MAEAEKVATFMHAGYSNILRNLILIVIGAYPHALFNSDFSFNEHEGDLLVVRFYFFIIKLVSEFIL